MKQAASFGNTCAAAAAAAAVNYNCVRAARRCTTRACLRTVPCAAERPARSSTSTAQLLLLYASCTPASHKVQKVQHICVLGACTLAQLTLLLCSRRLPLLAAAPQMHSCCPMQAAPASHTVQHIRVLSAAWCMYTCTAHPAALLPASAPACSSTSAAAACPPATASPSAVRPRLLGMLGDAAPASRSFSPGTQPRLYMPLKQQRQQQQLGMLGEAALASSNFSPGTHPRLQIPWE
jgi:hypothetical protein